MQLIPSIIQDTDSNTATSSLTCVGFRATCIASTGGFWRKGNSKLLIGLEDGKGERALELIRAGCFDTVAPSAWRSTIFVLKVADYLHFLIKS